MRRLPAPRRSRAGNVLWAILGILIGLGAALYLTWVVWPVQYTDADPADLLPERKALWAELVSDAYALTGDLETARDRLALLGVTEPGRFVAQVAEARAQEGASLEHIRAMARLSEALGGITARLLVYIATPAPTPTPTLSPTPTAATATPTATRTATATAQASLQLFRLSSKRAMCAEGEGPDIIAIYVLDERGDGISGIRVEVRWAEGSEVFHTGLKPDIDPGFADYVMEAGREYSVTVGVEGSDIASGIRVTEEECPDIDGPYHHEWVVRFRRTAR